MQLKTKVLLLLSLISFCLTFLILNILVSTHLIYTYEVNQISTKEKIVMLTFDDGPNVTDDNAILDILEQEEVSGMFFQTGINIDQKVYSSAYQYLENRILTGPSFSWIGNHTYAHRNYINNAKLAIEEINKTQILLQKIYQQFLNISINTELVPTRMAYLQYFNGMDYVAKKTDNNYFIRGYLGTDYKEEKTGKEKILHQYLSHLHPGQIFICHTRKYAKEWLPELIHNLKDKGYKFASFNPNSPNYYKKFGKLIN